jgi:transcriptional regulator with XRE-family HTH domain
VWEQSGLRQEEFAERLAYSRPTVANMIRGTHLPPLGLLDKVEEAFPGTHQQLEPLLRRERQERELEKEQRAQINKIGSAKNNAISGEDMRFRRRPSDPGIDLSGTWHAVWEISIEGETNIDTEVLRVKQVSNHVMLENEAVSAENPIEGYLWHADCILHDNAFLMGTYAAIDPNHRQRGVVFYNVHRSGQSWWVVGLAATMMSTCSTG